MLIRCGCLRGLPDVGFVDMKEQGLPQIAGEHVVRVVTRSRATGHSIRNRETYLRALRSWYRPQPEPENPFAEDGRSSFALVEDGAEVDPTARIHDSVVLAGARVEAGASVIRSVICPGSVVPRRGTVIEEVSSGPEETSDTEEATE
jgi:hypothetical protein